MAQRGPAKKVQVLEALRIAEGYLAKHGIESARLSSEHLLARRMSCSRLDLYLRFEEELGAAVLEPFREDLKKRATHYPLQYIVGEIEFLSLPFRIREGVFIPRPETELLVEWVEEIMGARAEAAFVEFGIGCGVISGSLCARHPGWKGRAVDISEQAAALAVENLELLGVADRMEVSVAGSLDAIGPASAYDIFVANPPYVPTGEIDSLEEEVSRFEAREAIDGGARGIDLYPMLAAGARRLLVPGGLAAFEIGYEEASAVLEICAGAGLERASARKDYNGFDRMVTAFGPGGRGRADG